MMEFFLFRLRLEFPKQLSMFHNPEVEDKSSLIMSAILERPSAEIRKNNSWHIGNIEEIDTDGLFFLLGKGSRLSTSIYDENDGNFKEGLLEQAPYTFVFVDTSLQLCAIAKKNKVSQKIENIAKNLSNLLNKSDISIDRNVRFVLSQISNPNNFLNEIEKSYAVTKFIITLSKPNPSDSDKDFHEPLKKILKGTNAETGKTELNGKELDKENISKITMSVSTTGDNASARLIIARGEKPITIHLGQNPARLHTKIQELKDDKIKFFNKIQNMYFRIRGDSKAKS